MPWCCCCGWLWCWPAANLVFFSALLLMMMMVLLEVKLKFCALFIRHQQHHHQPTRVTAAAAETAAASGPKDNNNGFTSSNLRAGFLLRQFLNPSNFLSNYPSVPRGEPSISICHGRPPARLRGVCYRKTPVKRHTAPVCSTSTLPDHIPRTQRRWHTLQ